MLPDALGFAGRSHQGATDAVNAALNYGYGILTAHVWGAVMNAGLEPFAGFLHVDRSGKPSLVLDLMEEFRQPVVDRPILSWLNKGGQLSASEGHARRGVQGKRCFPRVDAPGGCGTAPRQAASGAVHYPDAGSLGGKRRAGLCGRTDHFVQVVKPWRGRIDILVC
jgi:hypothetical protein